MRDFLLNISFFDRCTSDTINERFCFFKSFKW